MNYDPACSAGGNGGGIWAHGRRFRKLARYVVKYKCIIYFRLVIYVAYERRTKTLIQFGSRKVAETEINFK